MALGGKNNYRYYIVDMMCNKTYNV